MAHLQGQDWNTVTFNANKKPKKTGNAERDAAAARQSGLEVETVRKNTPTNAQRGGPIVDARKLDEETEEFHLGHVELDLRMRIQQARQAKGWSQKDFAQRINEKATVVNEYESGRAIPNPQIISKMERALGCKLRGKK